MEEHPPTVSLLRNNESRIARSRDICRLIKPSSAEARPFFLPLAVKVQQ